MPTDADNAVDWRSAVKTAHERREGSTWKYLPGMRIHSEAFLDSIHN